MKTFKLKNTDRLNEHYPVGSKTRKELDSLVFQGRVSLWHGKQTISLNESADSLLVFDHREHVATNTIWLDYIETIK